MALQKLDTRIGEFMIKVLYLNFSAIPLTFILSFAFIWIQKEGIINSFIVFLLTYLLSALYKRTDLDISGFATPIAQWMFDDLKSVYLFNGILFLAAGMVFLALSGKQTKLINDN